MLSQNNTECGTMDQTNNTQQLQEIVREFYAEMNDVEVDNFGRELLRQIQPQGWPDEPNTALQTNNSVWTPIIMYVILSTTIILISLYHREIIDTLFTATRDIVTDIIPSAITGLIPRDTVQRFTLHLLENPETHQNVINAMNRAREIRRMARGG